MALRSYKTVVHRSLGITASLALSLQMTACLTAPPVETTGTDSESESETEPTTTGPGPTTSTDTTVTPTTLDPTTIDPETETQTESEATTDPPTECGNGEIEAGEECDDGPNNSDGASCTSNCMLNVCGDGLVLSGTEACDDGEENGNYDACAADCSGDGPSCGDGNLDADFEDCDMGTAESGCVPSTCQFATSCLELGSDWEDLQSGPYTIYPSATDTATDVYCDMTSGWTYLKLNMPATHSAAEADEACMVHGLHLYYPSSDLHLESGISVAMSETIVPFGADMPDPSTNYLRIMAIYPVQEGVSCVDFPFNSDDCPDWLAADGGDWWVSTEPVVGEPSTSNCTGCSMFYTVDADMMAVTSYEAFTNQGAGAKSKRFLCTTY